MVLNDITMFAFSAFNSLRMIAYIPQIVSVARDGSGCRAISYPTWGMFMAAHVSAVAYALVNVQDNHMALVFAVNATCCAMILAVVLYKRRRYARKMLVPVLAGPFIPAARNHDSSRGLEICPTLY